MRLDRGSSFLLVVDVQEKLAPHVQGHERLIARAGALVRAAKLLDVPVLASEHCPDRIGRTVPVLRSLLGEDAIVSKVHFSCADEASCLARFNALGRRQVVIAGIEAHVCVMQTALGLVERGFRPFVVRDAVGSRRGEDRDAALQRMAAAGCGAATAEMALFEWMHRADAAEFRQVLGIVKEL
jgi:nicotinamidase-related amidase